MIYPTAHFFFCPALPSGSCTTLYLYCTVIANCMAVADESEIEIFISLNLRKVFSNVFSAGSAVLNFL